jgi:hypothetical protein
MISGRWADILPVATVLGAVVCQRGPAHGRRWPAGVTQGRAEHAPRTPASRGGVATVGEPVT